MLIMAIVGLVLMLVFTEPDKKATKRKKKNNGEITQPSNNYGQLNTNTGDQANA